MSKELSMAARREITKKYAREYAKAGRAEKSVMLDALVTTTGWTRDHARRAIRQAAVRKGASSQQQRKPRPRKYSYDALVTLQEVWRLSGQPSGKYLAAVMGDTLERLVRFRELGKVASRVTPEVLDELCAMSPATIDRYLKPHKDAQYPTALGTTKPSQILRASIAVRTSMDELPAGGGFYELDTVAHCGHTTTGEYLHTLTMTDPKHGWTMLRAIKNKAHKHVKVALEYMRKNAPVKITGMDFDNGSEFMNWAVIAWADQHHIDVTRGRPYEHNDNAHVEQRNGDWVRKHAFRYRYETDPELQLLNELWRLVEQRKNHLLPCVKVTGTKTSRSGRKQAVYDKPETPYSRLLRSGLLDEKSRARLAARHEKLNPARITRRINQIQQQLIDLAAARTQVTRPAA